MNLCSPPLPIMRCYATGQHLAYSCWCPCCVHLLLQELGLPVDLSVPLLGFIGRLDEQKGVDLIAANCDWLMEQGAQLVLLGSGRPDLEEALRWAVLLVGAAAERMLAASFRVRIASSWPPSLLLQENGGAAPAAVPCLGGLLGEAGAPHHRRWDAAAQQRIGHACSAKWVTLPLWSEAPALVPGHALLS